MNEKGFSILEILVVVAIISALMLFSILNFPSIRLRLALVRAANIFEENARKAQQMALSGLVYRDASGAEHDVDGYGIHVDFSGLGKKQYLLYADKSPGNKQYDAADYIVETVDFSSTEPGTNIKEMNNISPADKLSVNFSIAKIETTITQLAAGQNAAKIIFSLESDEASTKTVSINTSGLIEVE